MFFSTFQHILKNLNGAIKVYNLHLQKKILTFLHIPPGDHPPTTSSIDVTTWKALAQNK